MVHDAEIAANQQFIGCCSDYISVAATEGGIRTPTPPLGLCLCGAAAQIADAGDERNRGRSQIRDNASDVGTHPPPRIFTRTRCEAAPKDDDGVFRSRQLFVQNATPFAVKMCRNHVDVSVCVFAPAPPPPPPALSRISRAVGRTHCRRQSLIFILFYFIFFMRRVRESFSADPRPPAKRSFWH
jgi:hypothetical protein